MAVIQLERDWFFSSINSCCRERPRSTNNNTTHKEEVVQKKKMLLPQNYRVESSKCSTTTDVWLDVNSMHEEMKQNQIDKPDFLNEIEISDEDF